MNDWGYEGSTTYYTSCTKHSPQTKTQQYCFDIFIVLYNKTLHITYIRICFNNENRFVITLNIHDVSRTT